MSPICRRKTWSVLALFCALALPALAANPVARPVRQYTIEQFMATTRVSGASFSPDEKEILFSSNQTGIFNVYRVPVAGGSAVPVTSSTTDTTLAVSFFPTDRRVLYTRDQGGNELNHLYLLDADGKERDLTPGEKLKAQFGGWTRRRDAFWVRTNERDQRYFDLYRYDAATLERKLFYRNDEGYSPDGVSDDGKWVALGKPKTTSDSDLYLWNSQTKETRHISAHQGTADYSFADFDPASTAVYYLTNDGAEFTKLRRYVLSTGKHEEVEKADWDISYSFFSRGGAYRVTGINEDGRTVIRIVETATGKPVALPKLPEGDVTSVRISDSEKKMAFYFSGDRSPANLYVMDLPGSPPRRLTDASNKEIDPEDLVEASVVRFRSFDGMTIPSIFFKPQQAAESRKAPALVWVHGGPGGQTRKGYSAGIQYLVNHGYVVLGINNRGSSGYGKTFYTADDQKHGREPLWDCVEAKKYLQSLPYVDKDRIGIIGGSYGGYMVLAALAFQPDQFAVGVDIFGVSNWVRTLESIPKWWESQRLALYKEIGDPETQKAMLTEISPLFHADKIRRPLIVLQGANDPRVIKPESDEIVEAARKNGVPVEYVVFPDEGHGFTKRKNEISSWKAILDFLDKYLKASAAEPAKKAA